MININSDITTKVYGRARASLTIHLPNALSFENAPVPRAAKLN